MKIIRTLLAISLLFSLVYGVCAQSSGESPELRDLRAKIGRLESMSVNKLAPPMQDIYKRTLLDLYEQLLRQVQRQIDNSQAAHVRETLNRQKQQLLNNIEILRLSLGLSASGSVKDRSDTLTETKPPESPQSESSVTSGANPTPVTSAASPAPPDASAPPERAGSSKTTVAETIPQPATPSPAKATGPVTATPASAPPLCDTSKVAPIVKDAAERLAGGILIEPGTAAVRAQRINLDRYKLVFYSLADALDIQVAVPDPTKAKPISVRELEPYKYLGETVRTDKQLGASASSAASVNRIDKAGFAWLLGLGIENGQVEKNVRDTVLTLSTSPAALYMLDRNAENPYHNAGVLNRFGVSASFNISDQNQLLANATRSQLREYSIKYRFAGDRSARSDKLQAIWDNDIAPSVQARLKALNDVAKFMSNDAFLQSLVATTNGELQAKVVELLTSDSFKAETDRTKQRDAVTEVILCYLLQNVYTKKTQVSEPVVSSFKDALVPNLVSAQLRLKFVREALEKKLDEFFKGPLGTVAYINHREPLMGNYSEFKLLFEHPTPILGPLTLKKLTANAGFSFYHEPNAALKQERLRSVNGALSFEGRMRSPFAETADLGQITYSLVGRYDRLFENGRKPNGKADLASLQFLMDFPLFKGFAFPFSLTYSNATELERKKGWRANFGFKLDTDKLLELVRAAGALR